MKTKTYGELVVMPTFNKSAWGVYKIVKGPSINGPFMVNGGGPFNTKDEAKAFLNSLLDTEN